MNILPIQRVVGRVAAIVTLSATVALLAGTASAAPAKDVKTNLAQVMKRSVLQFPIDVTASDIPNVEEVSDLLSDVVLSRMSSSGVYTAALYSKSLPAVARLLSEHQIADADVAAPFDNAKAAKVTKAAEYEVGFVGSVDDYKFDADAKQVDITVSGSLIDVTTGKVIKLVTLGASSTKGGKATEDERALEAARTAGEKMMAQLIPAGAKVSVVEPGTKVNSTPPTAKKKNNMGWLWALVAVGVGLGVGLSGGGSGSGGVIDLPPAPPH